MKRRFLLALCILLGLVSCQAQTPSVASPAPPATLKLTSPAFDQGATIPAVYTCDGQNISPPLAWDGVPQGTRALALIVEDPDAPVGTYTHWVLYDLPPTLTALPEGVPLGERPPVGGAQGKNDARQLGYFGPCPPSGSHRYIFTLYALNASTNLAPGASKRELLQAMQGHILAQGELMGRYQRR